MWENQLQIDRNHLKSQKDIIISQPLKSLSSNADLIYINLLDFKEFQYDPAKRHTFLEEETRKEMCKFLGESLKRTKKCVIIIPPETFVEDFAEIFDIVLFDEHLQKFHKKNHHF